MTSENDSPESSDSDDDQLAHLREAADTNFINDSMFQLAGTKSEEESINPKPANVLQSQRYITNDNDHIDDQLIPEEVQKFVSKKLTKIIESRVEFVDVKCNDKIQMETTSQSMHEKIKLLDDVVLKIDWNETATLGHERKKPEIRKRKITDVDDSKTESIRLKETVIDAGHFQKEVINWKVKPKGTLFEYREKNGVLLELDKKTEFSEKRKKNNWDESKISRNKTKFK